MTFEVLWPRPLVACSSCPSPRLGSLPCFHTGASGPGQEKALGDGTLSVAEFSAGAGHPVYEEASTMLLACMGA